MLLNSYVQLSPNTILQITCEKKNIDKQLSFQKVSCHEPNIYVRSPCFSASHVSTYLTTFCDVFSDFGGVHMNFPGQGLIFPIILILHECYIGLANE